MRPVNLIPPEDRRGESAPSRTGALSYILVGALVIVLGAVSAITLVNKSVADKEVEVAALEKQEAELSARAASLASFSSFAQVKQDRQSTVTALAQSRFDWERVIRELSKVIPNRVWLVSLTGKVSPSVSVKEEATISLRAGIEGPALEMIGCARSQRDVARMIAAIGDIDGVTRVAAGRSSKPENDVTNSAAVGNQINEDCRTRNFVARFELVAAFDSVVIPEGAIPPAPPTPAPGDETTPTGSGEDGGSSEVKAQKAGNAENVKKAQQDAEQAADIVPGGSE